MDFDNLNKKKKEHCSSESNNCSSERNDCSGENDNRSGENDNHSGENDNHSGENDNRRGEALRAQYSDKIDNSRNKSDNRSGEALRAQFSDERDDCRCESPISTEETKKVIVGANINKKMLELGSNRSEIRDLFENGIILKQKYGSDKVYDFSLGNPNIPAPISVKKEIINLINESDGIYLHSYTQAQGNIEARKKIANSLNKKYGADVSFDKIYMTVGAAAGLTITLKSLINEGDEIVVISPYFPEYKVFVENANGKLVVAKSNIDTFYPDMDDLRQKINKNTKAVLINSPNNPTGVFYTEDVIKGIVNVLNEKEKEYNKSIFLISDEPYRELLYVDKKYPFITNYYDNSLVEYSFSKSMSLPGERIGYIVVNKNCSVADELYYAIMGAGRSMGYVCANSLFQYVVSNCIDDNSDINLYKKNKEFLTSRLREIGYKFVEPDGAFYLFVKCPICDDRLFSKTALKYNLLLVPSSSFGISGYVRIAYCVDYDTIKNSIESFRKLYGEVVNEKIN